MIRKQSNLVGLKKVISKATTPSMRRGLLEIRDRILDANVHYRKIRGWMGTMPDFMIIGAQRCGTTYLYDELTKHPHISPAFTKEVHYFDMNFDKGIQWYQAFFPRHENNNSECRDFITGEASPCYIFFPHAAERIFQAVPDVKLILLLRDPVSRAYSHYHHEVRLGFETLPFEAAIEKEAERLSGEKEKMLADKSYYSHDFMHYSYMARGVYIDQILAWLKFYPAEQMLIIRSEDFYQNTASTMRQVISFLELPAWEPEDWGAPKVFPYPKMDSKTKQMLVEHFEPHNQRLYHYLGADFGWNR